MFWEAILESLAVKLTPLIEAAVAAQIEAALPAIDAIVVKELNALLVALVADIQGGGTSGFSGVSGISGASGFSGNPVIQLPTPIVTQSLRQI
jgi:hypothetical protein